MNNAIYDIIYNKLLSWLTPTMLRKQKMLAWIAIIISPVQFIYQDLLRFRTQKLYELSITPQVVYLQKLLNDRYDYVDRRIRIVDALDAEPIYLFVRTENHPVYFFKRSENKPVYLYTRGESGVLRNDFVVQVPSAISFQNLEMKSLIQTNKLTSKKFAIQIV